MQDDVGIAWYMPPGRAPIFLVVDGGNVVDCTPYAAPWAMGRTAAQILARGERDGATVVWTPLNAPPQRFQPHREATEPIRRWRLQCGRLAEQYLTFGRAGQGWMVRDTREPHAWRYTLAEEAWTECRRRTATGVWVRINAGYGPRGEHVPDPDLPDRLSEV